MIRLAVLGHPISHSRSPQIHIAALAACGLEGSYEAIDADEHRLAEIAVMIRSGDMTGANVTMPLKGHAFRLCDRTDHAAARTSAVNTLFSEAGALVGANTDVPGLKGIGEGVVSPDQPVLILGSGGAAAAAAVAFDGLPLFVAARSQQNVTGMLERVSVDAEQIEWGRGVKDAMVVNGTPLGMAGESLPQEVVSEMAGAIDMAYATQPTPLIVAATDRGIPCADGLEVLVAQAAISFEIWTGVSAPVEEMTAAA